MKLIENWWAFSQPHDTSAHKFVQNKNYHRTWITLWNFGDKIQINSSSALLSFSSSFWLIRFCACNVRNFWILLFHFCCCFAILHFIFTAHAHIYSIHVVSSGLVCLFPSTNSQMPITCDKNHHHHHLPKWVL